jgi:hypothetical protein
MTHTYEASVILFIPRLSLIHSQSTHWRKMELNTRVLGYNRDTNSSGKTLSVFVCLLQIVIPQNDFCSLLPASIYSTVTHKIDKKPYSSTCRSALSSHVMLLLQAAQRPIICSGVQAPGISNLSCLYIFVRSSALL